MRIANAILALGVKSAELMAENRPGLPLTARKTRPYISTALKSQTERA
jgi:hypothetical protein